MEYPHWLIVAGAILLMLNKIGLALRQRGVEAELNEWRVTRGPASPRPSWLNQGADRTSKLEEQKRDQWADKDRSTKEPLNERPKIYGKESK